MWHVIVKEQFYNSCVNMSLFNLYLERAFVRLFAKNIHSF
jgi:hypothetical protein